MAGGNTSGADVIPKGSRLKRKRLKGVRKIVRCRLSGDIVLWQDPEFASSLEKILAPASWPSVVSTLGIGWTSFFSRIELC